MPRDLHHAPKHETTLADHPIIAAFEKWAARVLVPVLANQAARAETAGRHLIEAGALEQSRLSGRITASPVQSVFVMLGLGYVVGVLRGRSGRRGRSRR